MNRFEQIMEESKKRSEKIEREMDQALRLAMIRVATGCIFALIAIASLSLLLYRIGAYVETGCM